jgi:hypothetical protein
LLDRRKGGIGDWFRKWFRKSWHALYRRDIGLRLLKTLENGALVSVLPPRPPAESDAAWEITKILYLEMVREETDALQ